MPATDAALGSRVRFLCGGEFLEGRLVFKGPIYAFSKLLPNHNSDMWHPGEFYSWRSAMHNPELRCFTAPSKNSLLVRVENKYYSPDSVIPVGPDDPSLEDVNAWLVAKRERQAAQAAREAAERPPASPPQQEETKAEKKATKLERARSRLAGRYAGNW